MFSWAKRLWLRLWRWLRPLPEPEPEPRQLLTVDMIIAKALCILHQRMNHYAEEKEKAGVKPGSSLRIRVPVQYTVHTKE